MAQVLVNFRMEEDIKHKLEGICDELGLNLSTAFNMFARKMIREERIPFNISLDDGYDNAVRDKALESFKLIRKNAMNNKKDWSLDEVNSFISKVRKERK